MDADDLRAMLTPDAMARLDALGPLNAKADVLRLVTHLRDEGVAPRTASAIVTQARLRRRAQVKFGEFANRMLFTEPGLEQATRLRVAAHHANRFRRAGTTKLADLGCGIGADSLAFASLGFEVLAVDRDEVTAAIATHNLAPFDAVRVVCADAIDVDLDAVNGAWVDPARRASGQRLPNPADWSPSLEFAFGLGERLPAVGVKLGPALPHELLPETGETQWVSVGGELVECSVWLGTTVRAHIRRSALVLGAEGTAELTSPVGVDAAIDAAPAPLGAFVFEPDPAVIRARLIGEVADQLGGGMLAPGIAWITGDDEVFSPFASRFRVREVLPLHLKPLKQALRERNIGELEIKVRGVDVDPATLRQRLQLRGADTATLICTRIGERRGAILAERETRPHPETGRGLETGAAG